MQLRTLFAGIALGAAAALVCSQAISQQHEARDQPPPQQDMPQQPTPEQMAAMMEDWMRLINPGPQHKLLEKMTGEWNSTTEMYLQGPDAPPVVTQGKSMRKMVLGGRFVLQEEDASMMLPNAETGDLESIPWNGMGLFGYDNIRNLYTACWADSMGTQIITMKGAADPAGRVFTYYGEMDEPMLGVIGRTVKYVTTIVDENTQTFEIFDLHAGEDYRVFRITYERATDE